MALATDQFFGDISVSAATLTNRNIPGLPGHRPAFIGGFRVSGSAFSICGDSAADARILHRARA